MQTDGSLNLKPIQMNENSPKGKVITQLVVSHEASAAPSTVSLLFNQIENEKFFSIVKTKTNKNNSTHTLFDITVESKYDLFDQYPYKQKYKEELMKFICKPNQLPKEKTMRIEIYDVNDAPKFSEPETQYQLIELAIKHEALYVFQFSCEHHISKFPIKVPFSKLYDPIYVTDNDFTEFGHLKFSVWDDDTLTSPSTIIRAEGKVVNERENKYLVDLYLLEYLNSKIKSEHNVILKAEDKSATSLSATTRIKIVVQTDPTELLKPKFEKRTYSTVIKIQNKSINKDVLDVKIAAKIDDGSTIRFEIDNDLSEFPNSFSIDDKAQIKIVDKNPLIDGALTTTVIGIRAISFNQPMLSDLCLLTIKILHTPDFDLRDYSVYTSRNTQIGTAIWSANAGPFMEYKLAVPNLHYQLNSESGVLYVRKNLADALDETLEVVASKTVDGQVETIGCQVTIRVVDDVQSFTQLKFEKKQYRATIGIKNKKLDSGEKLTLFPKLSVINKDKTSRITYEIDKNLSDCPVCFDIDARTGEVKIIKTDSLVVDRYLTTKTTLIIRVTSTSNTLMSDTCSVSIQLVYAPEFVTKQTKTIYIDRDSSPTDTVVWTCNTGPSATSYSIEGTSEHYAINPDTGVVSVKKPLIDVTKEMITISASTDINGQVKTDKLEIEIHVVDSVYSLPYLQFEPKQSSALVNVRDGTLMKSVSVRAIGDGASSAFYEIDPKPTECADCFSIDKTTGQLQINDITPLVKNQVTKMCLTTKVGSSVDKIYSDVSTLSVQLVYAPLFEKKVFELYVPRNSLLDGSKELTTTPQLIKAKMYDDSGIQYEIDETVSECANCFKIDNNGKIVIDKLIPLIENNWTKTTLIIRAVSELNPNYFDLSTLSIQLVYAPEFVTKQKKTIFIDRDSSPTDTVIWTCNTGPSATSYSIEGTSEHYAINPDTGVVSSSINFDVNEVTGILTIKQTLENVVEETVTVIASSKFMTVTDQAQVTIHVVHGVQNSARLKFGTKKYSATVGIKNNALDGSKELTTTPQLIKAKMYDDSGIQYEIDETVSECANCFKIDNNGKIVIDKLIPLIENNWTKTTLIIRAISTNNPLFSDVSFVSIQLSYHPEFASKKHLMYIPRNLSTNTILWTAQAGPFMTYSLENPSTFYDLNGKTGAMSIIKPLDDALNQVVVVNAANGNSGIDQTQVSVNIVDNVESLKNVQFEHKKHFAIVEIKNEKLDGSDVLTITPALIAKAEDGGTIEYEIDQTRTDFYDSFEMNKDSAEIKIVNVDSLVEKYLTQTTLIIRATSPENLLYSDTSSLSLRIMYKPNFKSQKYHIFVPRNSTVGTIVWTAQAGPFLTYSIKDEDAHYEINKNSGAIRILTSLDTAKQVTLTVVATSGTNVATDSADLTIFILENVETFATPKFEFENYIAVLGIKNEKLDSDPILKSKPDSIKATIDDNSKFTYEFDETRSESADSFSIDKETGVVQLVKIEPLVKKQLTKTTLLIRAISELNPNYFDLSTLSIRLVYKPYFEFKKYSTNVNRLSPTDMIIWTAQAGPFMTYSIIDPSGLFAINEESGAVRIKAAFSVAEKEKIITVTAATTFDGTLVTDNAELKIHIFDEEKSAARPIFEHKQYSAVIGVKNKKLDGPEILVISPQIKASVSDNSLIHFEIDSELTDFATSFSIKDKTKAQVHIIDLQPLIKNNLSKTTLLIKAVSTVDERIYDVSSLLIRLVYKPTFQSKEHSVFIYRTAKIGSSLWTANAGPFVTYSFTDLTFFYEIDKESGILSVKFSLQNAGDETLNVIAEGELGKDETRVKIHVLEDDISQAGDKHSNAACPIEENVENAECIRLSQSDDYEISKGNDDQKFKISNGQLVTNPHLDYEENHSYFLILRSEIANKTLYVTANVLDMNEAPYFETMKEIFAIAPWIQPNNVITAFRAKDPDTPNTPNAAITYSISCSGNQSKVFNLNSITGQLQWVETPTETVYYCNVYAKDGGLESLSDSTKIKIFSLKPSNIFSLKVEMKKALRRKTSDIERDLSDVLEKQVVLLLLVPGLRSQNKIEYQLFALDEDTVMPYIKIEELLSSKKEKLNEIIGDHSFEPYNSLEIVTETKVDSKEKSIAIIALSAVLGVILAITGIIGFIVFRKYRSATLQNSTSRKALLLDDEETNIEHPKIESNHSVSEAKAVLNEEKNVEIRPRIVSGEEVTIEELPDPHFSQFYDLTDNIIPQIVTEDAEIDYKQGDRKSVSFNQKIVNIPEDEARDGESAQIEDDENVIEEENVQINELEADENVIEKENVQINELEADENVIEKENVQINELEADENVIEEENVQINELEADENVQINEFEADENVKIAELKPVENTKPDELKTENFTEDMEDDSSNEDTDF
uniref:Cadherin domain-containing protein n=1 Tax=Strigamia maritima TaxID=126957 RepID=T1J7P8_STRMM